MIEVGGGGSCWGSGGAIEGGSAGRRVGEDGGGFDKGRFESGVSS